jgi:hypothetical protein
LSGPGFDPEDPFGSALGEVLAGPEVESAAAGRSSAAELERAAGRWRRAVERRTELERAAYGRALTDERDLAAGKLRSQNANFVLLVLAALVGFLLLLVDYLLLTSASPFLALGFLAFIAIIAGLLFPRSD